MTRFEEPNIIIPIHKAGIFPPLDDQIQDATLRVQLPLLDGGRRWAARRAAQAGERESRATAALTEVATVQRVADVFLTAAELKDRGASISAYLKALEQRRYEMALLASEGRVSPVDTALLRTSLESLRADSLTVASLVRDAATRLGAILGMTEPVVPSVVGIRSDFGQFDNLLDSRMEAWLADAAPSGPVVDVARARLDRAEALKTAAARSFWPEIGGFFVYSYRAGRDWDFTGEWTAGAALTLPLFEGGSRFARKRSAAASLKAAHHLVQAAWDEQRAAEAEALQHLRTERARRERLAAAVEAKALAVNARRMLYENGDLELSVLSIDEAELLKLEIARNRSVYDALRAILNYHAVVGSLDSSVTITFLETNQ